jgi:hypothetical protein
MKPTALLAMLPLAACMTLTPDDARLVTYACEGGEELTVIYGGQTARIDDDTGGPPAELRRMTGSTGVLYSSSNRKIRGEGDTITYQVGRAAPLTCTVKESRPANG